MIEAESTKIARIKISPIETASTEIAMIEAELIDVLMQWFSTWVPRNHRVPREFFGSESSFSINSGFRRYEHSLIDHTIIHDVFPTD